MCKNKWKQSNERKKIIITEIYSYITRHDDEHSLSCCLCQQQQTTTTTTLDHPPPPPTTTPHHLYPQTLIFSNQQQTTNQKGCPKSVVHPIPPFNGVYLLTTWASNNSIFLFSIFLFFFFLICLPREVSCLLTCLLTYFPNSFLFKDMQENIMGCNLLVAKKHKIK